ncbi:hypothetical protein Acr_08g0008790 [Actinidia rufa]|uniref:Late embryogenesis abundant protein LEA-2 subgroup domain-containing protein n=1 Tax=Actinidia rufa TaxID=165716 RepID=A0A7J0F1J4_9ERIC|nr:hypothetical protein Acr_08g0008790 [Actinidia rufa]
MEKLKCCAEKHQKKPEVNIVGVDLEGITKSEGLIFKAKLSVHNPYSYAVSKWKSADYTLTCRNREIAKGSIPPKLLKAKTTTPVEVVINVTFGSLKNVWEEVLDIVEDGLIKYELKLVITFELTIIGDQTIALNLSDQKEVSSVWNELLANFLPKKLVKVVDGVTGVMKEVRSVKSFCR